MSEPDVYTAYYESPIGTIEIQGTAAGVSGLNFVDIKEEKAGRRTKSAPPGPVADALAQLEGYFHADRKEFAIKLDLRHSGIRRPGGCHPAHRSPDPGPGASGWLQPAGPSVEWASVCPEPRTSTRA